VSTRVIAKSDVQHEPPGAERPRETEPLHEQSQRSGCGLAAKLAISGVALGLLILKLFVPEATVDGVTVGILAIAILPWASDLVESAQFPGGWGVTFRRLEERQQEIAEDVSTLRFLVGHLITEPQKLHLEQLAAGDPFVAELSDNFLEELRHLRRLGFINNYKDRGTRTLKVQGGDVKEHFYLTARGHEYLTHRQRLGASSSGGQEGAEGSR
jgi:hypothetical protein